MIQNQYKKMEDRSIMEIKADLDFKYKMKRPSYEPADLEKLKKFYYKELNRNSEWKDFWVEEDTLIRFLKAHVNVQDALDALSTYCDWRHKYDVDNISPDDKAILMESSAGRDKIVEGQRDFCGRPVVVLYPEFHDINHGDYPSLFKYITFQMDQLVSICNQQEDSDGTFCLVVDMKNFSMKNMDYTALRKIFWILKNCYPERLGVALIINYPWVFYRCWEIIKLWLNEVTRSKVHFCTQKEIVDFIDTDACEIQLLR